MYDNLKIGQKLEIHCYKHNGKLHRQWDEAVVLEIHEDYVVFGNNKTTVIDSDGKVWKTKEPAIMYFYKNRWFNIIGQIKEYGIYYYCNIATPYLIDENVIKYIDYDLDLRVFPSGDYKILDRLEYKYHKKIMNYSDDLDFVIKSALDELINLYKSENAIFNEDNNIEYYQKYEELKNNNKV